MSDFAIGYPPGDVQVTVVDSGRLRIDHADKVIGISDPLMQMIRSGEAHPDARFEDDVLTISAVNRKVAYRISEHHQLGLPDGNSTGWWLGRMIGASDGS